jgi:signal transduction histidine kinase
VLEQLKQSLLSLDPLITAAVAAALAMLCLFAVAGWWQQSRAARLARNDAEHLQAVAIKGKEILAAAPDGLFLWDHVLGGITISRKLAVLLNLEAGLNARFDDIRALFDGDNLKALERGCSALRGNGTPFNLVLKSGERTLHAIGQRAETAKGDPLADLVWMRDISTLAAGDMPVDAAEPSVPTGSGYDDRHLTALLDALPVPVWLRDAKFQLAFANIAATDVADLSSELAKRAKEISAPVSERRLVDQESIAAVYDITEIPLNSLGGGTLGYAIDRTAENTATAEIPEPSLVASQSAPAPADMSTDDSVLDSLPSAIAIYTADTRLNYFNAAFARLWGLDQDWLKEKPDLGDVLEKLRDNRSLPEVADFKVYKAAENAKFHTLSDTQSTLMHLPDGRTLNHRTSPYGESGLAHIFEDQSERLDLQRAFKELGAVQIETLDNLHEGVAVFGSDGRLKLSNPIYAQFWGLTAEDLEGEPHLSEILEKTRPLMPLPEGAESWTDDTWRDHKALLSARLLSRAQNDGQLHLTNETVIEYANVPLPDGAVLLSYIDVTDSARIEQALRDRAQALEDANLIKSQFIADVAREVRTPMNTVIGFADMLGQEYFGKLNPRQNEYASGIASTSRSLVSVVGDILDLAALDAGQLELKMDSIDVHGLLVSVLHMIEDRAMRRDIKLTFECPPDIGWVVADGDHLKQIVYKLLTNAITYTPPHGSVTLKGERNKENISISVSDTGVGIPTADKERIFTAFDNGSSDAPANTTEIDRDERGVGLGLTIAKRFIEKQGGTIEVRSQLGRGTMVTCHLPGDRLKEASDS